MIEEANYREISQEYGQGAIKAVILVNGGAAVAVLSQYGELSKLLSAKPVATSVLLFAFGVFLGVLVWLLAFLSTRYVDRTLRKLEPDYKLADRYQAAAIIALLASLTLFLVGCIKLAWPMFSQ